MPTRHRCRRTSPTNVHAPHYASGQTPTRSANTLHPAAPSADTQHHAQDAHAQYRSARPDAPDARHRAPGPTRDADAPDPMHGASAADTPRTEHPARCQRAIPPRERHHSKNLARKRTQPGRGRVRPRPETGRAGARAGEPAKHTDRANNDPGPTSPTFSRAPGPPPAFLTPTKKGKEVGPVGPGRTQHSKSKTEPYKRSPLALAR